MPFRSRIRRSAIRIALVGASLAVLTALGGRLLERARMGATDEEAFARLEATVRRDLNSFGQSLQQMASPIASNPDLLLSAARDQGAARALFEAVDAAWRQAHGDNDMSLTAYDTSAQPLAWMGRPSEIDRSRIVGDASALFAARGPLGLRLVHVQPVFDRSSRRAGTVAAERVLSMRRGMINVSGDIYTLTTSMGPVTLRTAPEGAGEGRRPYSFLVRSSSGAVILEASAERGELAHARTTWRRQVGGLILAIASITLLLLVGPLLNLRADARRTRHYVTATVAIAVFLIAAWAMLVFAGKSASTISPAFEPLPSATAVSSATAEASVSGTTSTAADATVPGIGERASRLLVSPFDFLLGGLALIALVGLAFDTSERWRLRRRTRRPPTADARSFAAFAAGHLLAAAAFAVALTHYQLFLRGVLGTAGIDVLHFSVHPWNTAPLLTAVGLLLCHAAVLWLGVLLFRLAMAPWRTQRAWRSALWPLAAWSVAFAAVAAVGTGRGWPVPWPATAGAYAAVVAAALLSRRIAPRFRHASHGLRLVFAFLALLLPAIVMYPTLARFAEQANRRLVETNFAPEVMNQREAIKTHVANAMDQVDAIRDLPDLARAAAGQTGPASTQTAFWIWTHTDLARNRIASAVELYGAEGALVSPRFALYLPEFKSASSQPIREQSCSWDLYEYVSPFGSEQRKLLRAGRALCVPSADGRRTQIVGSIVIHAMLDYSALPFLSSQNPYYELLRPVEQRQLRRLSGGDIDLVVYGWSRTPIYTSAAVAWPLDTRLFARVYDSRRPFWTTIESGGTNYAVYVMNDRGGIYALGYPLVPLAGHLVNLAEMSSLVGLAYLLMLGGSNLFTVLSGHRAATGRALLREIRASFYRKVFLAFVAVAVVPVITLAFVAQAYIGSRLRADNEAAAIKTTAVAQRVIEDYGTLQPQAAAEHEATAVVDPLGTMYGDDIMVGLSRIIDQDVNVFVGPELAATSERDLFESQLLPMRTPSDVYRAVALDRRPSFVGQEQTGEFTYMVAAAPVRMGGRNAILTVPLMLRQQEIEREIEDLNRRIVLATLMFILIGAAIGYPMAERIAQPVNRLTRATRRIARGELDARIAATSSDELRRLVEAFNSMAADLQRQREQLERTNRLEAWAEMARQVAHEIKNPLTPIQLSAEHLRRVHSDRGEPLSPVLEECVASILSQVRLLRQIAGEFSSFASSPVSRPAPTAVPELLEEVLGPYRTGLAGRITISQEVPPDLPSVQVDRVLVGRALANVIENALHAMPGTGALSISAGVEQDGNRPIVRIAVTDNGVGMDKDTLAHLFEPYFSTKAIGTGLGLAIAKRNVELSGGTISVDSEKGRGTTVYLRLPVSAAETT